MCLQWLADFTSKLFPLNHRNLFIDIKLLNQDTLYFAILVRKAGVLSSWPCFQYMNKENSFGMLKVAMQTLLTINNGNMYTWNCNHLTLYYDIYNICD